LGPAFFNPRRRSLLRGTALVVIGLLVAVLTSGFPHLHWSAWFLPCLLVASAGAADTARCMRRRWDWYHGGVILLLYADLMVLVLLVAMIGFSLLLR
jgi:hypothetical protein